MRKWNDDPFTKKARLENYEARSVYKLKEIEKRERVFQGVKTVIDLGASPGSWTQYTLERLPQVKIYAVDLAPLNFSDPRVEFFEMPIEQWMTETHVAAPVDIVLSDMAPKTSGIVDRDVQLSFELSVLALQVADTHLKPGGNFVAKIFMGDTFEEFHRMLKSRFATVKLLRPESTRKQSREIFTIGKGRKPKT